MRGSVVAAGFIRAVGAVHTGVAAHALMTTLWPGPRLVPAVAVGLAVYAGGPA